MLLLEIVMIKPVFSFVENKESVLIHFFCDFVFVGVACGRTDLRVPYKDIKDNKISLEVLHMGSIPLKHPSSYGGEH